MAQDPLAMVYGGQIGQGQAQVFDTSGIAKQVIAQNKEKDKVFLDSIIDLDVSKVWNQDLPEYNEMWGKYRTFVSDNYKALSNPSRNVDKWSEKKRMEQELLNFVATSNSQKTEFVEYNKSLKAINNDNELKWQEAIDEKQWLDKDKTIPNPNYGRTLSNIYKNMPLKERSYLNIWDMRTPTPKGLLHFTKEAAAAANKAGLRKVTKSTTNAAGEVTGSRTEDEFSDKYLKVGEILSDPDGVPNSGDETVVQEDGVHLNPNAGQLYYDSWMSHFDISGSVRKSVEREYNKAGFEGNLETNLEDIREFWHKQASLNIKGMGVSERQYRKRIEPKTNVYVNISDKKSAGWDISGVSDYYTDANSSYVKANNGVGVTVFPMRYKEGTAPFMSTGSEFKGKIMSNFGGDFSGATMPTNAKFDGFYKDNNGKIGFSVSMKSSVIADEVRDKTQTINSKQSQLDKIEKDKPQVIENGQVVPNPKIATLQKELDALNKEISEMTKVKNQDQRLLIPLEDANGAPINLSILNVNGLPSTIEEIEGIVGGRSKKKPKHTI